MKKTPLILDDVLVEDYAAEGKSLARVNGKVIFIEQAVPGDRVDLRIFKNKKDWAEGRVLHFREYSKERVIPFCQHFGVCGGCQWQMLPYEKQLEYKQKQVIDNLNRIGKVELPVINPIIGAQKTKYYRNKIEYTFSNKKYLLHQELGDEKFSSDENVAGYHARGFFDKVVNIETCYLQPEPTNELRMLVKEFGIVKGLSFYDVRNHKGFLRNMQIRMCRSGEIMVNIVFGHEQENERIELLELILKRFPSITTLLFTINTKWNDSLDGLYPQVYSGNGYVTEFLEDFRFRIGPKSFFQTNTDQAEKLYQVTREFAALTGNEIVYDLYCGTGSIGIFLSRNAKKVVGIESIVEAVEDANENAALNNIEHARFFTGDVGNICTDEFTSLHGRPDVIICDPPRAGLSEKLIRKLVEISAPVIVYISCNPATQARDVKMLSEKYRLTAIQPIDMFPHTHHIENVVRLNLITN